MPSSEQKQARDALNIHWPIATQLTLGMGTLAVVMLTQAGHVAAQALTQIGLGSEELFRGERLPSRPLIGLEPEGDDSAQS